MKTNGFFGRQWLNSDFGYFAILVPLALFYIVTLHYRIGEWLFPNYSLYDIKRICELLLLVWCVVYLLVATKDRRQWLLLFGALPALTRVLLLAVFCLGLLSVANAPNFRMAMLEFSLILLLVVFTLFLAQQRVKYQVVFDRWLVAIILLSVILYEGAFFGVYFNTLIIKGRLSAYPGFVNIRFFAQYLTWTLPLIALPISMLRGRQGLLRTVLYLLAALWWALAFSNGGKGMFLGLIIAVLFGAVIFRKQFYSWLMLQIRVAGIGFVCYLILFVLASYFFWLTPIKGSVTARLELWQDAARLIVAHPLLGAGPMHFSYYWNSIAAHPHNSLLLIAAEWGLPVAVAVAFLAIFGMFYWCRNFGKNSLFVGSEFDNYLPLSLTVALVAGFCNSLVDGVIIMPLSQVTMALLLGWMVGLYFADLSFAAVPRMIIAEIVFALFLILAGCGLFFGVMPDVFYLPGIEITWLVKHNAGLKVKHYIFNPRFWLQGWIY